MKILQSLIVISCIFSLAKAKFQEYEFGNDKFNEKLDIYAVDQELILMNFGFEYIVPYTSVNELQTDKVSMHELQKLPLQLLPLLTHSEFENIKFKNTQGRWDENICPQILNRNEGLENKCFLKDFETHQPGFSFFVKLEENQGTPAEKLLEDDSVNFYINQLSSLFGVDRNRSVTNIHEFSNDNSLLSSSHFHYYGNLKEELCDDNLSLFSHMLNSTCQNTGILSLYNRTFLHHSEYKSMIFEMTKDKQSKEFSIEFNLAFVVNRRYLNKIKSQLKDIPKKSVKIEELINTKFQKENYHSCMNSDNSEIFLHQGKETKILLEAEPGIDYNLALILGWIDYQNSFDSSPLFEQKDILSKRHFNDIYYDRKLSFVHMIKNQSNKTLDVTITEFFPYYLQMYTKDIHIDLYESGQELGEDLNDTLNNKTKTEYTNYKLSFDKGNIGLWFRFSNLKLDPNQIMVLRLKLKKNMISAQNMPVDVSMDANVPPLPILYREADEINPILHPLRITYSQSWVIVIMEPDFSMAFNLNAMFFGVLGAAVHWLMTSTINMKDILMS